MNGMRKAVCFLLAMLLAAIALPGLAAPQYTKQYSLTLSSSPAAPLTVVVHLTNEALGPGNSNIGSFRYTFTGATIASVTAKILPNTAIPPGNITLSHNPDGPSVFVALGSPLQGGQTIELTILLNDCGDGISLPPGSVQVWTGKQGQPFTPVDPTVFPLTTSVVCGNIACGDSNITVPASFNPGSVTITRDFYDKDGISTIGPDLCATVPYTVTNIVPPPNGGDKLVHLAYPIDIVTGDPAAAFELNVIWPGLVPAVTKVAWLNTNHTPTTEPGTPDFITAVLCNANANFLPTPYGTLAANVLATDTTIRVNTTIPTGVHGAIPHPGVPFDIVIGPEPDVERMTVTVQGGPPDNEIWHVTRGAANVGPAAFHAQGMLAMSEPLPIMTITQGTDGQYAAGNQVQMCIKAQSNLGPGPLGPHSTTYIVVGDPWASQP